MALPLDQLVQPMTKEQAQASILGLLGALGLNTTAWQPGGVTLVLIGVFAQLIAGFSEGIAFFVKMGFLDHATGAYLTLLAYYGYGVTRVPASFASGNCTVTNTQGALYTFKAGKFVIASAVSKQTYVNTEAFTLQPVGVTGDEVTVGFIAQAAGAAGTAEAEDLSQVVTGAIGVTVSNPSAFIGVDEELDPALRTRCRDKLGSLSPNGPKGAYAYVAKGATNDDGSAIGINRVRVVEADGTGELTIYIATPTGGVTTGQRDIIEELFLDQCVPDGVDVDVVSADPLVVNVDAEIWVYTASGLSTGEIETRVSSALAVYFPTLPIGGLALNSFAVGAVLYRALEAVMAGVSTFTIEARVSPETDIYLASDQVAVLGTVDVDVHLVEGP